MSQEQYNLIQKARLTDIANLPAGILFKWLNTKPEWLKTAILKSLVHA